MIFVLDFILFLTLLIGGVMLAEKLLPHRYLRVRLRKHLALEQLKVKSEEKGVQQKAPLHNSILLGLEEQLQSASIYLTPREFLMLIGSGHVLLLLIGGFFGVLAQAVVFALLCDFGIYFMLKVLAQRRKRQMVEQLPDALTLMSSALKSGYSILQTIDLVSKEDFVPLSQEFGHLVQALKFGENFDKAFRDFSDRLQLPEITTVVDTILITRETGGNMTVVIEGLVEMLRENERLLGEVRSLSAQGKISALVVGCLPAAMFFMMYLINRSYIMSFFEVSFGLGLLAFAVVMQLIGVMFLRKIIRLKVR